ncbi:hypothetical protein SAMN05444851_2468 [Aliiroseovarius sediminilitoris]|uniref:Uncharacterized protein n=1 Tax=Aliiroseovarius sediminilitoris TaxID=1173584 RepID=A0A1I0QE22_9RHOB|nr:hypothetical protein [Aliiroseovarius sediminilitoris]SEW25238.1 hypothetical protein SAMN05444851_2468 [Aliiroseovarius sediminilitoris]
MTALTKYQRLEAAGLWRADTEAQRRDVIVSLGDATLTISDTHDTALTHWSLPAIIRLNPAERPALFSPGNDATEVLEIDDDTMIRAIEKVRKVVERRRPHPGRLRHWITAGFFCLLLALGVFWMPNALRNYTVSVLPDPTREAVGQRILNRIGRVAGQQCDGKNGQTALDRLTSRVLDGSTTRVIVLSGGVQTAAHLPGRITLLNRALIEDYEEPDVVAGFLLAEDLRRQNTDPMKALLEHAGLRATAQILTTGDLPDSVIDSYAEDLLTAPTAPINHAALLARFAKAGVRSTPYAYALDLTGETTLELIEADPVPLADATPLLTDANWVRLQGICGE